MGQIKSPRQKALELAIKALEERRHEKSVDASADRYGFLFGIHARAKVLECDRAIMELKKILEEKPWFGSQ